MKSLTLPLLLATTLCCSTQAQLSIHPLYTDHAVLQSHAELPIKGWADAGAEISVKASWEAAPVRTTASDKGRWLVKIKAPGPGGPHQLTVTSGEQSVTSTDLLVGDVWLCSGQSNMQWPLNRFKTGQEAAKLADFPQIRFFQAARNPSAYPLENINSHWEVCSPKNIGDFSGIGYYFADIIHREVKVPIGMIGSYWGGTPVESWLPDDTLVKRAEYQPERQKLEEIRSKLRDGEKQEAITQFNEQVTNALASIDPGFAAGWANPNTDTSSWQTVDGPVYYTSSMGLNHFDGIVWCRKSIVLPEGAAGKSATLHLAGIDDRDIAWINGQLVGATLEDGHWATQRVYSVPEGVLVAGTNTLAVLILDTGGGGGMMWNRTQPSLQTGDQSYPLTGTWSYKKSMALSELPSLPNSLPKLDHYTPSSLYMGMIQPLVGYPLRGFLWYQGESNVGEPENYVRRFPDLIQAWREKWEDPTLPFYYVQIAPYHYNGGGKSPFLRDAQRQAMSIHKVGMVVTTDIGNPRDIHPAQKREVAERLALWALQNPYGKADVVPSGPLYDSMQIEGSAIRIRFQYADGGLVAKNGDLTDFTIAARDRVFKPAQAVIDGDTIRVYNPEISAPVAVRFGWTDTATPNLFNKSDLPASPFRTDDWSL